MPTWGSGPHPLLQYREERRVQPTDLPANVAAREREEADQYRRSVEGQRELHARADEARRERAQEREFWVDQYRAILAETQKAEGARFGAFEAGDLEAAVVAQQRVLALRSMIDPLRQAAAHKLGPTFNPASMERA